MFLREQTDERQKDVENLFQKFIETKQQKFSKAIERDEATKVLSELTATTEEKYMKYKKEVLADFTRMAK